MRDHTKLRVFELADALALEVYRMTAKFPKHELFGLVSQMRRAAVSVPCNIVEGAARESEAEYVRFLEIAYGSSRELQYQISLAQRLGYVDAKAFAELDGRCTPVAKSLNGLVRALKSGGSRNGRR